MAQVKTAFPIKNISGRLGEAVFIHHNGRTFMRRHTVPGNPRTEARQTRRGIFAGAVRSWQALKEEDMSPFPHPVLWNKNHQCLGRPGEKAKGSLLRC